MKHQALITAISSFAITACTSQPSIPEPAIQAVKPVNATFKADNCQFIDFVEGFGAPLTGGMKAALRKAREKTARLNGNAIFLVDTRSEPYGNGRCCYSYVTAEALLCDPTRSN